MRTRGMIVVVSMLVVGTPVVFAHEEHEHGGHEHAGSQSVADSTTPPSKQPSGEQTLTGEVVDVTCYLEHDKSARGLSHADCAKKCIKSGLPVAIKVGDQLYLAAKADHTPANTLLAPYAGQQVEVHGTVMEQDGQRLIAISSVKKAQ